jgi:hypothetical protein
MQETLSPIPSLVIYYRHILISTVILFISSAVYSGVLSYCLAVYASVEWAEYGFSFGGIGFLDVLALCFVLAFWAVFLPKKIQCPSSLFLVVIYLFVCVPAAVATIGLQAPDSDFYYPLLFSLAIGFALACLVARSFTWSGRARKETKQLLVFILIAWIACLAVLVIKFGSVMSFSGLDEIYLQREQGKAGSLFEGYIQTYFGYVFSPFLLAFGLVRKNIFLVVVGFVGAVVIYMITAEKAVFIYPFFILSLFFCMRLNATFFLSPSVIASVFSLSLFLATLFYESSAMAGFVAWYLGIRSLLVPGVFLTHYNNFFADYGYTFGTHITGVNLFVETPLNYYLHSRWPSIGHLVGEDYLGIPTLNANASFLAADGLASFGLFGVVLVFLFFSFFLVVLDWVTRGVQSELVLLVMLPLSLTLTNGSLFTGMLSFGGFFFLMVFALFFKKISCKDISNDVVGLRK